MRRLTPTIVILCLLTAACGGGGDGASPTTVLDIEPISAVDPCDLLDQDTASELVGDDVEKVDADVEEGGLGCTYNVGSALGASMAFEPGTEADLPGAALGSAMGSLGEGDDGGTLVDDAETVEVVYIVREVIVTILVQPVDGVDPDVIDAVVTFAVDTEDDVIAGITGEATPTTEADATTTTLDDEVPEGEAIEIDGDAVTITIDRAGGEARLNFEAGADDIVFIELLSTTTADPAAQCIDILVIAPDDTSTLGGTCVGPGPDAVGFLDRTELPDTGTYGITVNPRERDTGQVTVQITSATDERGSVEVDGDTATATVAQAGARSELEFRANAGDVIFIDILSALTDGSDDDQCIDVLLFAPDGTSTLGGTCVGATGAFIDRTELPDTGTYTLRIDPRARDTGTVELQVTSTD